MKMILNGALLSTLYVAYRASWVTAVLQQYVRNVVLHSSLFSVGNTLLAPLWLPGMFLHVHPNAFNVNTFKEGIPTVNPTSESSNLKLYDSIEFPEAPGCTQQLESPSNHMHLEEDECKQWACDSETDVIESESDCYSSDEDYEDYEIDGCLSDDCVEFSDDSIDPGVHTTLNAPCPLALEHVYNSSVRYKPLFSEESGYCELHDDSDQDSDYETCEVSPELACVLWKTFEEQALSPCPSKRILSNKPSPKHNLDKTCTDELLSQTNIVAHDVCQQCTRQCTSCNCATVEHSKSSKDHVKHVAFKSDSELVVTHHIIAWSFAYRTARKGPWEEYARDRDRFTRRIESCASILEPCLSRRLSQCSNDSSSSVVLCRS